MDQGNGGPITAKLVPDHDRLKFLPRLFGTAMVRIESEIYDAMSELCSEYTGGYWHFYTLSNGGFYMAPATSGPMRLQVDGNGYDGLMSGDAAGIVAVLMMFSHTSFSDENFSAYFHALREFALEHAERDAIFAAID